VPARALSRVAISCAVALGVALILARLVPWRLAAFAGWNAGALALLALAWLTTIAGCTAASTKGRAAGDDPGRTFVYVLVLLTCSSSLIATAALVRRAKAVAGAEGDVLVALCLANVAICWALTHTAFALRYAHLYYREDAEGVGGVDFPGKGAPTYFDFAYFAFTIGMCFQVSDSAVTSPQIRRLVLLHALLSFVYNTAILAFVLNLVFGFAG
jgi:uncharacterized membrane protein